MKSFIKKPSYIYLICILCIYACGSDLSPSEEKIKNEISSIYLAKATFEDIKNATLGEIKGVDVKNIHVSRSAILDTLNSTFALNSIATIAYEHISQEERDSYDYIGVTLTDKNGEENPYSFLSATLKEIDLTKKTAYQFAQSISEASYKNLEPILDTGQEPAAAATALKDYFTGTTATAGPIVNYSFYGVGEGNHQSKTYYTHLGTFFYKNGVTQNFFINVFEGESVTKGYNINPIKSLTR